jgi:hypothetical protein
VEKTAKVRRHWSPHLPWKHFRRLHLRYLLLLLVQQETLMLPALTCGGDDRVTYCPRVEPCP